MTGTSDDSGDHASEQLSLFEDICRVAHRVWRERMIREGWNHGSFDEEAQVHDALVPYENLTNRDLHVLEVAVEAEEVERMLSGVVEYERGPERLFMIDEMQPGMRVGMASYDEPAAGEEILGTVMGWEMDKDGPDQLGFIEVRWDDGKVMQYHPEARDLRRLEA